LKKIAFGVLLLFFSFFNFSIGKEDVSKEYICNMLMTTILECEQLSRDKKIAGKPDPCNTLALSLMGATIYTLSENGKVSEDIVRLGQILGKICYRACVRDKSVKKEIEDFCD
jgi:hypothetical protein